MRCALEELGYDPNQHRSQGISAELLSWADQIIVMGNVHEKHIQEKYPEFIEKVSNWNVKDPHFAPGEKVHRAVAREIETYVLSQFVQ